MKEEVIRAVRDSRIIAIIRGFTPDECLKLAEAYREGGIRLVEVTFNQRDPSDWANTAKAIRMTSSATCASSSNASIPHST